MSAPLFETDGNPLPAGIVASYLQTANGKSMRYALLPTNETLKKGTVIILHGRNECIEKYFETMTDLAKRGFGTATFDWLGQGGSARLLDDPVRGHIDNFDQYEEQFDQFFDQVALPDCRGPFFVLAHSTGSLVAIKASPRMINRVRRIVLCSPLLGLTNQPFNHNNIRRLSWLMKLIGLGGRYMGGGPRPRETKPFAGNHLTSDERRYKRNSTLFEVHPELALGSPTVGWVNASCRAMDIVQTSAFKATVQIPTLIIAAGADKIVSNRAVEQFMKGTRSTALITIDGAKHEILHEADFYRDQVFAAFDAFVPGSE
jgi:lysophospholipase